MTTTGPVAENESRRSSRGEDKSEEEQEEGQEEEWRAKEVYESTHHHSNYLNRKRRAPRGTLAAKTKRSCGKGDDRARTHFRRAKFSAANAVCVLWVVWVGY